MILFLKKIVLTNNTILELSNFKITIFDELPLKKKKNDLESLRRNTHWITKLEVLQLNVCSSFYSWLVHNEANFYQ